MLADDAFVRTSDIERNFDRVLDFRIEIQSKFSVKYISSPADLYQEALIALSKLKDRVKLPADKELTYPCGEVLLG